jgi:hypothetical protein
MARGDVAWAEAGAAYAGHSFYPWLKLIEIRRQPPVANECDRQRMRSHKVTNNACDPQCCMRSNICIAVQIVALLVFKQPHEARRSKPICLRSQMPQCIVEGSFGAENCSPLILSGDRWSRRSRRIRR